jgi:hypothetical protein
MGARCAMLAAMRDAACDVRQARQARHPHPRHTRHGHTHDIHTHTHTTTRTTHIRTHGHMAHDSHHDDHSSQLVDHIIFRQTQAAKLDVLLSANMPPAKQWNVKRARSLLRARTEQRPSTLLPASRFPPNVRSMQHARGQPTQPQLTRHPLRPPVHPRTKALTTPFRCCPIVAPTRPCLVAL